MYHYVHYYYSLFSVVKVGQKMAELSSVTQKLSETVPEPPVLLILAGTLLCGLLTLLC